MYSIRRQLLCWLLALVVAGIGAAGWLIYRQALAEANELFDYQLQKITAIFPFEPFSQIFNSRDTDDESIALQIWNRNGVLMYCSHPRVRCTSRVTLGFSTERTERGDWRVYGAIVGDNIVQLAQPVSMRNQLAANVALRTLWPLIVLLPFLGLAVWVVVGHGLAPLARLTRALHTRHPEAFDPLPDQRLPFEVSLLVKALNALLVRLAQALDTQKAFVADAAHELRTPLTAVQIQAQLVARARDDEARRESLADLQAGVMRATRLVEQLLALARSEPDRQNIICSVDLHALLDDCVATYAPLAQQRGVDLGIEESVPAMVNGNAEALRVMFNNLLDNATKYTPASGRVDVSLHIENSHPVVRITDTGPGIPVEERPRVFGRFYRVDTGADRARVDVVGSGLGLAIVRRTALQHEANVTLGDSPSGGLLVSVRF